MSQNKLFCHKYININSKNESYRYFNLQNIDVKLKSLSKIDDHNELSASFDMKPSENVPGRLMIPELVRLFCKYSTDKKVSDISAHSKNTDQNKIILDGKSAIINEMADELEILLSSEQIEYIYAHSASQQVFLNYPSGVFFMNVSVGDAKTIQKEYGVICKNEDDTDTDILDEEKEISCINNDTRHDWKEFFKEIANSPTNSIIICDRYLFSNEDGTNGQENLIDILDSILPRSLKGEYHILLLCSDIKNNDFNILSKSLYDNIIKLRRYRILFLQRYDF